MKRAILMIVCLVMIATVFSSCSLLGDDKDKEATKDSNVESNVAQNKKSNSEDKAGENGGGDENYYETVKDLMEKGKTMECTYTQEVEGAGTATGVVYMADKKARTEITIDTGKMYSITDQEWVYSWTDSSSQGFKMSLDAVELGEKNEETVSKMTDKIEFKCKSWKKDSSKFEVPSDITFEDMSAMMDGFEDIDLEQEIADTEAQGNEFICNHCKNAPASEQEECLGGVVCDW